MTGLRKLIVTGVTLLLETGAFIFVVLVGKTADAGMLTAYFVAVAATLGVYTTGNVLSKVAVGNTPEEPK
jgi:hypothetical protein